MTMMIAGLVIFLGIHSVPMVTGMRDGLVSRLGNNGYRGLFALLSLIGLVLIVWGKSRAAFDSVYVPLSWGRHLAMGVMPVVFVLLAAANMPGHIRRVLKHPMLIATMMWAAVHLAANGDLASIVLFGSFGIWALIDMISEISRGKVLSGKPPAASRDAMAVVGGLIAYVAVMHGHSWLFGAAIM